VSFTFSLDNTIKSAIAMTLIGIPLGLFFGWLKRMTPARTAAPTIEPAEVVVCRPAKVWAVLTTFVGIAAIGGGFAFAIYIWTAAVLPGQLNRESARLFAIAISLGDVLMGIYFILGALKYRIILEPDAITLAGIFIDRTLRRNEIRGKKFTGGTVEYVTLYPTSQSRKWRMRIAYWYDKNAEIEQWVCAIPML